MPAPYMSVDLVDGRDGRERREWEGLMVALVRLHTRVEWKRSLLLKGCCCGNLLLGGGGDTARVYLIVIRI